MDIRLGTPVEVYGWLYRHGGTREVVDRYNVARRRDVRRWNRIDLASFAGAQRGIVVGRRSLANGYVERGYEDPTIFISEERISVWLVAFNMNDNPRYVLPEDVTVLPDPLAMIRGHLADALEVIDG